MQSKRQQERKPWVKCFASMGISEDRLMKMSDREYQNTKDYLESIGETPDKVTEEEDEEQAMQKLLEKIKQKKFEQRNADTTQSHQSNTPQMPRQLTPQAAEYMKLRKEQDAEYEQILKEHNENQEKQKEIEEKEKQEAIMKKQKEQEEHLAQIKEKKDALVDIPPQEGVTIAIMFPNINKRIMRKFSTDTNLKILYSWTKKEYMNLTDNENEVPDITLRQPTGEILEENSTKTLSSEGITKNTLLNCIVQ